MKTTLLILYCLCPCALFAQNTTRDTLDQRYNSILEAKGYKDSVVYEILEIQAKFPQGDVVTYIKNHLEIPKSIKEQKTGEFLLAKCIVERTGQIFLAKFLTENSEEAQNSAKKVILCMPRWIPAQQDGKVRRSYITLPFFFGRK